MPIDFFVGQLVDTVEQVLGIRCTERNFGLLVENSLCNRGAETFAAIFERSNCGRGTICFEIIV